MEILWSPWRSKYIESFKDENKKNDTGCIFCDALNSGNDTEVLIITRRKTCFVILNKYPYNSGHMMVAPYRHIADMDDLTDEEMKEMMDTVREAMKILKNVCNPHGFNLGMNIGRVAGAGVPGHIHLHIVPRWNGDTSFMPVLADIKLVSQSLEEVQEIYSAAFRKSSKK
jgi:ATP adenylyltransferase